MLSSVGRLAGTAGLQKLILADGVVVYGLTGRELLAVSQIAQPVLEFTVPVSYLYAHCPSM